jgi:hypothetical protein
MIPGDLSERDEFFAMIAMTFLLVIRAAGQLLQQKFFVNRVLPLLHECTCSLGDAYAKTIVIF